MPDVSSVLKLFRSAARGKEIPEPQGSIAFKVSIDAAAEDDVFEEFEPEVDCIGRCYGIAYTDAHGQETQRRITVNSLMPQLSDLLVGAYCHERRAPRMFKASRMSAVVDLETGEVVEKAVEFFARYLTSDPTYDALRVAGPGLQVLAFIARCDGEYHETEKDCLVEYVMEKAFGDINVTAVRNHVEGLYPDSDNFERGLVRAAKQGVDELKNLIQWLNKVVDADGVLTNDEFDWLLEATDILNR